MKENLRSTGLENNMASPNKADLKNYIKRLILPHHREIQKNVSGLLSRSTSKSRRRNATYWKVQSKGGKLSTMTSLETMS